MPARIMNEVDDSAAKSPHELPSVAPPALSRRQLLQAAGGVTFLALVPDGRGAFATRLPATPTDEPKKPGADPKALPLFTALPYLQPGPDAGPLVDGKESLVIAWQTDPVPADYKLEYGPTTSLGQTATLSQKQRAGNAKTELDQRINHAAALTGLNLNTHYHYRLTLNGQTLLAGYFTTRKPRGTKTHFVAFGDNSYGDISDRAIAYQAYRTRPDFVMNTGDNVYEDGLDNEYARYFFPVYNADTPGQRLGAPLLRSVPFYSVIANHDVHGKDAQGHPIADFTAHGDSLAYYTNLYLPLNGPKPVYPTPMQGTEARVSEFMTLANGRFPNMANYSFDYGDIHFLCLDSNVYVDPTDADLQAWIVSDLSKTDAAWKFVTYHHPAFNAGDDHYAEQHMRVLTPLFEQHGVDLLLHGHEHTYQRTRPFKFAPADISAAKKVGGKKRLVPGTFTIDRAFDGKTNTHPNGIIYITTGAGGKHLYDPAHNDDPTRWLHPEDNNADYVARFVSDRHSLTIFDCDARTLTMTQVDEWGSEIDRIRITKSA